MFKRPRRTSCVPVSIGFIVIASIASAQTREEDFRVHAQLGGSNDNFGRAVAVSGGTAAVGAFHAEPNGSNSGSAALFDSFTGGWLLTLLPTDGTANDQFGNAIAVDGGLVAVSAFSDQVNGETTGSAYVFEVSNGAQVVKLFAKDGATNDQFGWSIAIDNGIVAVGAVGNSEHGEHAGAVYLFDAQTGKQLAKLSPDDADAGDLFGYSVSISKGTVVVGAPFNSDNGHNSGSAYLFNIASGKQFAKLLPSDGQADDRFGISVAVSDGLIAIGADGDDDNGDNSGSAYLFSTTTGSVLAKIVAQDGASGDLFGSSIDTDGRLVAVGAPGGDVGASQSGSAYLFNASLGASQILKLVASDGQNGDFLGTSISVDDGIIVVGSPNHDGLGGSAAGAAYIFDVRCSPDLNGDQTIDFFDVSLFLGLFSIQHPDADWNDDGTWDFFDVLLFLGDFAAGCS